MKRHQQSSDVLTIYTLQTQLRNSPQH